MERLIEHQLRYGGLLEIAQPHLIERYNAALASFGVPATELDRFSIDATGYSPEVAEELGNAQYLDPNGVNRRFVILTPAQAHLPIVSINFSSTIDIFRAFFRENAEALQILTLKDAVYGELDNSTYRVDDLADVLSIKHVQFRLATVNALLDKARRLEDLIDRFHTGRDSWMDDELIENMLELARECGDVRTNRIVPRQLTFRQRSFWTRHHDGLYVFNDSDGKTVVIGPGDRDVRAEGVAHFEQYIPISEPDEVYRYLKATGRLESFNPVWLERSGVLERRVDYLVKRAIAEDEEHLDLVGLDSNWERNWVRENLDDLTEDGVFQFLNRMRQRAADGARVDVDDLHAPHRFLVVRARPDHDEAELVNRLISEYLGFDFLTRFIVNKEGFYRDFESYPTRFGDYVVHTVTRTFFPDKEGFWRRMFT